MSEPESAPIGCFGSLMGLAAGLFGLWIFATLMLAAIPIVRHDASRSYLCWQQGPDAFTLLVFSRRVPEMCVAVDHGRPAEMNRERSR